MRGRARRLGSEYLLSGLVACERCGSLMVGGQDRRNEKRGYVPWTHYRCGGQHRLGATSCDAPYAAADRLEHAVVGAVLDQVLTPENFQRLLAKMRAALAIPRWRMSCAGWKGR